MENMGVKKEIMEKKIHNNYISREIAARSGELKTFREKVKDFFRRKPKRLYENKQETDSKINTY